MSGIQRWISGSWQAAAMAGTSSGAERPQDDDAVAQRRIGRVGLSGMAKYAGLDGEPGARRVAAPATSMAPPDKKKAGR